MTAAASLIEAVSRAAHPLTGRRGDYDLLLRMVGDARFVLLGEASHGTHEFYRERARITRRLIREKGFNAVAVEADWPDAYGVNRYVKGSGDSTRILEALARFQRFPRWTWRNWQMLEFIGWLRAHNDSLHRGAPKVGFYGLDLYSLHSSIEAVLRYLDRVDREAARRARLRYAALARMARDVAGLAAHCIPEANGSSSQEAATQFREIRRLRDRLLREGRPSVDEFFNAEQNARLVTNAERFFRSVYRDRTFSWNLRDRHMAETLGNLAAHLAGQGLEAKVVVWEHNSHLGDARATEMAEEGELSVGQLMRERYGRQAVLIGFSTYQGTVTAASNWDGPAERMRVRPALPGSYEALFHRVELPRFLLPLQAGAVKASLREARLERTIGVLYLPGTERASHYFLARLPDQFDALIHFDETRAVEPLERGAEWQEEGGVDPPCVA
jgi:erythromycin esterase-like protein